MASGTIQVTPELLRGKAKTVRDLRSEHDQAMVKLKNLIHGLQDTWRGEAQDAMVAKFDGMQQTFTQFSELLETYAKLMDTSAKTLEDTDNTLKGTINSSL